MRTLVILGGWVDVQADLSLCWSHRSYCRFLPCVGSCLPSSLVGEHSNTNQPS